MAQLEVTQARAPETVKLAPPRSWFAMTAARVLRSPAGMIGITIVTTYVLAALTAPWLAPYDPLKQFGGKELLRPSGDFLLGTDGLGRDVFSRILHGGRTAFTVALIAVGVSTAVGVTIGLLAGFLGGLADSVLMRLCDIILSFPGILIAIGVVSVIGPGSINVAWALSVGLMPSKARLIRAMVLSQRARDYVMAARSCGVGESRLMWRHILPNSIAPLIVTVFLSLGFAVVSDAGLSFLGLGTPPPFPSWGVMLNESRAFLRDDPLIGVWPGLALAILIYGFNSFSDALRDALDPRKSYR